MRTALSFAGPLATATGAALVHAFLPFLCTTTASETVKRLHARMTRRCANCKSGPVHRPDLFPQGRPSEMPDAPGAWYPTI
jgi:hypothetical protein